MNFEEKYINKIINGDAITVMQDMPNSCVDLVVTSPPYNIKNSSGGGFRGTTNSGKWKNSGLIEGYDNYNDNMPHDEYVNWQYNCLKEMFRVLKDDGAIFYNHKWRVQKGLLQDRQDIIRDLPVRQIIIWKRKGGINFNDGYFLPTYEVIYLITKEKFKLAPKANVQGDVWEIQQERNNDHPAPFPVSLVDKIITSTTAQIILDPFIGSGTTAIGAIKNNRKFIGIEISPKYCKQANERIEGYKC